MLSIQAEGTPSPVADLLPTKNSSRISPLHVVAEDCLGPLKQLLAQRGLRTLQALLEERGLVAGEWLAEHAQAQLTPGSGCESSPAWVAWLITMQNGTEPEHMLSLWAQDGRAARRALLTLQLQRAAVVHILGLPCALLPQLERWAFEKEDTEILDFSADIEYVLPPCAPTALRPEVLAHTECWAVLAKRSGAQLQALLRARAEASPEDKDLAMAQLQEFSRRLLLLDPKAEIDVAPLGIEQRGRLAVLAVRMNGHVMSWGGEIDRYTDVDELVRIASTSCQCC